MIKVTTREVALLADRLEKVDPSAQLMPAVNEVATDTRGKALDTMLRSLNLPRTYVEDKTVLKLAGNPVQPRATITGLGAVITNLERYFRTGGGQIHEPVTWPNGGVEPDGYVRGVKLPWIPRIGDARRKIPVGHKQAGLRVSVKRGSASFFQNAFLIRPRKSPGVTLIATRAKGDHKGKGKVKTKVGPSVYQMFRAALTPEFLAKVEEQLAKTVLDSAERNIRKVL
jgi:hypothetical protein